MRRPEWRDVTDLDVGCDNRLCSQINIRHRRVTSELQTAFIKEPWCRVDFWGNLVAARHRRSCLLEDVSDDEGCNVIYLCSSHSGSRICPVGLLLLPKCQNRNVSTLHTVNPRSLFKCISCMSFVLLFSILLHKHRYCIKLPWNFYADNLKTII